MTLIPLGSPPAMNFTNDSALTEMFRAEVETHMAVLNDGLLSLERDPTQSGRFESLMRAAHSIKGAAKIMGITLAVEVAHEIEDCFVAAREGRLIVTSGLVDLLLTGVDLLGSVAQVDQESNFAVLKPRVAEFTKQIVEVVRGGPTGMEARSSGHSIAPASTDAPQPCSRFDCQPIGALDESWAKAHHRQLATVIRQGVTEIHFDLSRVEHVDPIGLAMIAMLHDAKTDEPLLRPVAVFADHPSPRLQTLLRATGVANSAAETATED